MITAGMPRVALNSSTPIGLVAAVVMTLAVSVTRSLARRPATVAVSFGITTVPGGLPVSTSVGPVTVIVTKVPKRESCKDGRKTV